MLEIITETCLAGQAGVQKPEYNSRMATFLKTVSL